MSRNNPASKEYFNRKLSTKYKKYPVKQEKPLLEFLMTEIPGNNRTRAKQLLAHKMVYIDNVLTTQFDTPLRVGQTVQIADRGNLHEFRSPYVKILYEDAFLLVVEKAEGILTNTMPGKNDNSVKKILDDYLKHQNRRIRAHTVHRLDRVTSGVLVFAKRIDILKTFMDHWQEIVSDRRYIAVVEGQMEKDAGVVSSWLTDNKMFVTYSVPYDNGGKYAVTHYRVLKRNENNSLVELKLETGRKNQIRVHMQDLHHSIVGDMKYGAESDPLGRVCLHAYLLDFQHPITGEHLHFETPYPKKFVDLMK